MIALFACTLLFAPVPAPAQAEFQLLDLPARFTNGEAMDISDDGAVVVGRLWPSFEAFRWTDAGGFQLLGVVPGVTTDSSAQAVSGDGNVVVGWGSSVNVIEAFRWEAGSGMTHLPALGGAQSIMLSSASAVDRTASLVGGYSYDQVLDEGTLWPAGQAPFSTGFLASLELSGIEAIANDVPVAVGWSIAPSLASEATRWDQASGLVSLGILPGFDSSLATAVSDDGTRVLGTSSTSQSGQAFAWTAAAGITPLGTFPAGAKSLFVRDADAAAVRYVGVYELSGQKVGFYSSPATGVVGLAAYLTAHGATGMPSGHLEPEGLSADGNIIAGTAVDFSGDRQPFLARLAPVAGDLLGNDLCGPSILNSIGATPDLAAYGSDAVSDNDVTLYADELPPGHFALFIVSAAPDLVPNYFGGAGTLCLAAPFGPLGDNGGALRIEPGGALTLTVDLNAIPQATGTVATTPGTTWYFQLWYRDGGNGPNFTSARQVTFQ